MFRENLHFFMIGLGVVGFIVVAAFFLFYFRVKRNINKVKSED